MDGWMNGQIDQKRTRRANRKKDKWTSGQWTNEQMDKWTNEQMDKWTNGQMNKWTNEQISGSQPFLAYGTLTIRKKFGGTLISGNFWKKT